MNTLANLTVVSWMFAFFAQENASAADNASGATIGAAMFAPASVLVTTSAAAAASASQRPVLSVLFIVAAIFAHMVPVRPRGLPDRLGGDG